MSKKLKLKLRNQIVKHIPKHERGLNLEHPKVIAVYLNPNNSLDVFVGDEWKNWIYCSIEDLETAKKLVSDKSKHIV